MERCVYLVRQVSLGQIDHPVRTVQRQMLISAARFTVQAEVLQMYT